MRLICRVVLLVGYSTLLHHAPTFGAVSHALPETGIQSEPTNIQFISANQAVPEEKIKVIVLFPGKPVAAYRSALFGEMFQMTDREQRLTRLYRKELQQNHVQFLRQAQMSGIDLIVNHEYTYLLNGLALSLSAAEVNRLAGLGEIEALFPDREVFLEADTGSPVVGAPAAGDFKDFGQSEADGEGVTVAIIDTGIDYTHPDLGGCFGTNCRVVFGYDLRNGDADPRDDNGHGTHCAGIAGANGQIKGVAPGVSFHAYKVLDDKGYGSMSTVIAGIERAADPDQDPGTSDAVDIISLSLGSSGTPDDPIALAVDAAVDAGVTVVVSAGNYGPEYGRLGSPGMARKALAVGATDTDGAIADFSSRGPVPGFDQLMKPQIVAPGVDITSTWLAGGYWIQSGTSMAAPYAAGAAALVKQSHPSWSPTLIHSALLNNALDLSQNIYTQGAGLVQVQALANIPLLVSPGIVGLGRIDLTQSMWKASQILEVTNTTAETSSYSLSIVDNESPGMTATIEPETVVLAAGETRTVTLSVAVETSLVQSDLDHNQGQVRIQSGSYAAQIPFAYRVPDLFLQSYSLPYGVQSSNSVALGDLDGDGDEDAFIANANYYGRPGNTVWWNTGEGLFSDSGQQLGDSFSWAADLGDLDGDGDLDAFVANSDVDGPLPDRVWFNDGAGIFTRSVQSLGNTHSRDVALGDLDGDGDLDAIVVNSYFHSGQGEASRVWLNNGQGSFVDSGQNIGSSLSQGVALGDLDGDGDLDAFVANGTADRGYGRPNQVWLNNGAGKFSANGQSLGDSISQDVALGDLDGDGDLDAFVANGGSHADEVQPDRIWLNNGSAFFSDSGQSLGRSSSFGVALADLHGDGNLDAFVAGYIGGNKVWINDGSGQMHISGPGFGSESAAGVAAGDVDGDGDVDAVAANVIGRPNLVWLNRGSGETATGEIQVLTNRGESVWRITGPENFTGKASRILNGVPSGSYQIVWGSVPGCGSPEARTVTLGGGEMIVFEGEFSGCPPSAPKILAPNEGGDADMTPTFSWLAMGGSTVYHLQVDDNADFSSPEVNQSVETTDYTMSTALPQGRHSWRVRAANHIGESAWSDINDFTTKGAASIPFFDGFESGELDLPWLQQSTGDGRVEVSEAAAYSGSQGLLLDNSVNNGSYAVAAVEFMINLEEHSALVLSFWWRNWDEIEPHGQSAVFISADYGRSWHKALAFAGQMPDFQVERIDVAQIAREHGLSLNDHMLIRFQSFGDEPFSTGGGLAVDDVQLTAGLASPTGLTVTEAAENRIDLSWQDNAADESAYYIERWSGSAGEFLRIGSVPADTKAFSDTGLVCGTSYSYRLLAYRAADGAYSGFSNTAAASTTPCRFLQYLPAVTS